MLDSQLWGPDWALDSPKQWEEEEKEKEVEVVTGGDTAILMKNTTFTQR